MSEEHDLIYYMAQAEECLLKIFPPSSERGSARCPGNLEDVGNPAAEDQVAADHDEPCDPDLMDFDEIAEADKRDELIRKIAATTEAAFILALRKRCKPVISKQRDEFTRLREKRLGALKRRKERWALVRKLETAESSPVRQDDDSGEPAILFILKIAAELSHSLVQRILKRSLAAQSSRTRVELPITVAPLFQGRDIGVVGTSAPILSVAQGLIREDLWKEGEENAPLFRKEFSGGRFVEICVMDRDLGNGGLERLAHEAAWNLVRQFGVTTAYLHLIFAAYAMEQSQPWLEIVRLKGSDLIKTLGLDRRTDIPKPQKLKEIARQAHLLGSLAVWVVWTEGKLDLNVRTSRMWEVAVDFHGQVEGTGKPIEPDEITITVRPGLWTEKFLNRTGHKEGTALRQFGYLAKETLRINPYQKPLAAKLAIWLTIMGRIRSTFKVETLLKEVEARATLGEASSERLSRHRLKRRWDKALLDLHRLGWKIEFDPDTYPDELRPDWNQGPDDKATEQILPDNYWARFLNAKITINQPGPIPELITTGVERPQKKRTSQKVTISGQQVKAARTRRGWSQRDLGQVVGKSAMWVSLVERDISKISEDDQRLLCEVLQLNSDIKETLGGL